MQAQFTVGPKLKAIAYRQGHKQTTLAEEVGISRICLNRFFSGRSEIKAEALVRLMEALGLHPFGVNLNVPSAQ